MLNCVLSLQVFKDTCSMLPAVCYGHVSCLPACMQRLSDRHCTTMLLLLRLLLQQYGFPMTGVRRFRLLNVLLDKMEQMGIPLEFGKRLVDIQQPDQQKAAAIATATASSSKSSGTSSTTSAPAGPAVLHFQDGNAYEADLVVGFDGLRSRTRALLKGGNEPPPR
eukprot:GHRR01028945.1.p1 GENE.GHRR01028945.1~~GHRR01028945.1.p1  ORF type:complete len:165 (+),score=50.51 GHRR01028945.1:798-1292(+)